MTADKEKKEITVNAPSKQVAAPEKKAEKTIEKSLEEERFSTLQVSTKIGTYFGAATTGTGGLLLALLIYTNITGQIGGIMLSQRSPSLIFTLWVIVALVNIITGFLLLGSD
jgi:hypothetical protein